MTSTSATTSRKSGSRTQKRNPSAVSRHCPCDVPSAALSATVGWTESFAACVQFFRANLADPELDVPMMASAMALSVRSVHALFADRGLQPAAEIRRTRLRVAEQLLTQTSLDVAEVSLLVGIADPSVFARTFRQATGRTPSDFRSDDRQAHVRPTAIAVGGRMASHMERRSPASCRELLP